jgi:diacylglycerol kinase (ATP)
MTATSHNDLWTPAQGVHAPRKALLIINTKSGRRHDSITHTRELVDLLRKRGIDIEVRVKLSRAQARREARAAAQRGCALVVAAGGDGTVEAVARGLVGSRTALGIVPLGTYNNVATSVGVPAALGEAVSMIATGAVRKIDVGEVQAHGSNRPQLFLELATVGLAAALTPFGQDVEKRRWRAAAHALPELLTQARARVDLGIDDNPPRHFDTLLLTIANAPRAGAGLTLAPHARMDDGLLDVSVHPHLHDERARAVCVNSDRPLPVGADSRVVGTTPARIRIRPGALLMVGRPDMAPALPTAQHVGHVGWLTFIREAIAA